MTFIAEIPFERRFLESGAPADGSGGTVEAEVALVSAETQSGKVFEQYRKTARTQIAEPGGFIERDHSVTEFFQKRQQTAAVIIHRNIFRGLRKDIYKKFQNGVPQL